MTKKKYFDKVNEAFKENGIRNLHSQLDNALEEIRGNLNTSGTSTKTIELLHHE